MNIAGLKSIKSISVSFLFFVLIFAFFAYQKTSAQIAKPAKFLVSWSAESYTPPLFTGKTLPTANSPLSVSFEVIDGGKVANLSKQTIYWYLNNTLVSNSAGIQKMNIAAPRFAPNLINLRIEIPGYSGGFLVKTVNIPVVNPQTVIESPYYKNKFFGTQIKLYGTPYFFSAKKISDLNFSWRINGEAPEELGDPREFIVNLNPDAQIGSTLSVALTVNNLKKEESSSHVVNLVLSQ